MYSTVIIVFCWKRPISNFGQQNRPNRQLQARNERNREKTAENCEGEKSKGIIDEEPTYSWNVISPPMEARAPAVLEPPNELATRFTRDLEH